MSATCPVHGPGVMQESSKKPGSYYCPKKVNGEYCTWKQDENGKRYQWPKPKDEAPAESSAPPLEYNTARQMLAKQGQSVTGTDAYWLASLDFAAMVYRGTGKSAEAVDLAAAVRAILPS